MQAYRTKAKKLPGTKYEELMSRARKEYHLVQKHTPRRVPYVRSKYFVKDKVFLNVFWEHLRQKHPVEQIKRLKYYVCALDLLRNNTIPSEFVLEHNNPEVILHRFAGVTHEGDYFYVQVKDNRRTGRKDFMSVFPAGKSK